METVYIEEKVILPNTLSLAVSSFPSTSLYHCLTLLSAILYSKPFLCLSIIKPCDALWNYWYLLQWVFCFEIQLKKENLKTVFWVPEFGVQTGISASQTVILHWKKTIFRGFINFFQNYWIAAQVVAIMGFFLYISFKKTKR